MLVVDILLALVLVFALVGGIRRGLLASVGSLVGLAAGGFAAYWLVPLINDALPWPEWRGLAVLGAALLLLLLGASTGMAIGVSLRRGVDRTALRGIERLLGGAVSVVVAALAISLVGQSVAATGMPVVSSALASSRVLQTIDRLTPRAVSTTLAQLRGTMLDDGLPRLGELLGPGLAPTSPDVTLDDPALEAAAESVARVSGVAYACGTSATGSGFVVAPTLVVTNAHVVAGVDQPVVELPGETAREGRIVYFDPVDDLAVIEVDGLAATPLAIAGPLAAGAGGVVQGYPYGGPFTMGQAQVLSVGSAQVPDIYDERSGPRDIYALAAEVLPGNSGGPLLTQSGEVAGVIFARAESDPQRGYAMTIAELAPVLAQADAMEDAVSSGRCAG